MTAPTIVNVGALCGDTGPSFLAHQQGDLLLTIFGHWSTGDLASTEPHTVVGTTTSGYPGNLSNGLAFFKAGSVVCSHAGIKNNVVAYWCEAPASHTAFNYSVTDQFGNNTAAGVLAELVIRGHKAGDPFDVIGTSCAVGASSSITIPGVTTTVDDTLVLNVVHSIRTSTGSGTAEAISGWSNSGLASFGEAWQAVTGTSTARATAGTSGTKATAGATGNVTATNTRSDRNYAYMTLAIKPGTATRGLVVGSMSLG